MNKKVLTGIIALIVIVGAALGGYFAFHKSTPKTPSTNTSGNSTTSSSSSSGSSTAVNNSVLITKTNSSVGQYLAVPNGKTLYTFGSDTSGKSNCTGSCLSAWPAYVDSGATTGLPTNVGTIKRTDNGQTQYTYKGLPLYFFASDTSAGQVTGNGVGGFSVAKP